MPVTLLPHALSSEQEFLDYFQVDTPDNLDPVRFVCNRATEIVEDYLDREIVSRGSLTEEHTAVSRCPSRLLLREWPVIAVASVHENAARVFDADFLLTVDTDYIVSVPRAELIRVSSALRWSWQGGWWAIRVVYTGGYLTAATVPNAILDAYFQIASRLWSAQSRKSWGISSWSDDAGNFTRVSTEALPAAIERQLFTHRRLRASTGDRIAA